MFILFRITWWPSAGKELSPWLSALAVFISCRLCCVPVPFPLGVWDRMWNSIISIPDLLPFLLLCCMLMTYAYKITYDKYDFFEQ